jgi:hypothetical protein
MLNPYLPTLAESKASLAIQDAMLHMCLYVEGSRQLGLGEPYFSPLTVQAQSFDVWPKR